MSKYKNLPILVFNRSTKKLEEERVLGEGFVRFLYQTAPGRLLGRIMAKHRAWSRCYGRLMDRPASRAKIAALALRLGVDLSEVREPLSSFRTINEFFTRSLNPKARPVDLDPRSVISGCDARLIARRINKKNDPLWVKGSALRIETLLGPAGEADRFEGGTALLYRLCPADYHRFHFPEEGTPGPAVPMEGLLHSVNPIALATGLPVLETNLRHRTWLDTQGKAGLIGLVEVGALLVGSIVQTFEPGARVKRGEEKGMFRFGGSTVIAFYEPGKIQVDPEVEQYSAQGIEVIVKMGSSIGTYS